MIIASRILQLTTATGVIPLSINIFLPVQAHGHAMCHYEINWPDTPWKSAAGGLDTIQALHCAMEKIGIELYASAAHKAELLNWSSDWKGFGFPVPYNAKDMLVGDDAKFF
jgi:hypothetical protein